MERILIISKLKSTFAMNKPKPLIKFNGGNPIALCNRCFCIMCYVSCTDDNIDSEDCVVIERRGLGDEDYISTPIGKTPPSFCNSCYELLFGYSLN